MVTGMEIANRLRLEQSRQQTYGFVCAAMLGTMQLAEIAYRAYEGNSQSRTFPTIYMVSHSGTATSNSTVRIEAPVSHSTDQSLASELSRVFVQLVQNQTELDADAKRVLYGNVRRLYRR